MEHSITDRARDMAEQKKEEGAGQIDGVAHAIHGAARELESEMPLAAGYVHAAASRLQDVAQRLHDRGIDELLKDVNNFARSQPTAFFGGAVLAGFMISRFLKSSAAAGSSRQSMPAGDRRQSI
jgi:hypothetical protein